MYLHQYNTVKRLINIVFVMCLSVFLISCEQDGPHKPITAGNEKNTKRNNNGTNINFADVKQIFKERCVRCHSAQPPGNWLDYNQVLQRVQSGVFEKRVLSDIANMPPAGSPEQSSFTAQEKKMLMAWIKNGAPADSTGGTTPNMEATSMAASPQSKCTGCHGQTGISIADNIPNLAGLNADYILNQIKDFASGHRTDPTMQALSNQLDDKDSQIIAQYFAKQLPSCGSTHKDAQLVENGRALAQKYNCNSCHAGNDGQPLMPHWPQIQSQRADYLFKQMSSFLSGQRESKHGMSEVIKGIDPQPTEDELRALSAFYAEMSTNKKCQPQ